jgi:hypothetical protein
MDYDGRRREILPHLTNQKLRSRLEGNCSTIQGEIMSHPETDYVVRLIKGEEDLIRADGSLDIVAITYLENVAANTPLEQEVRSHVGEKFDTLLQNRMRAAVPLVLDLLRDKQVVHAVSYWVHFILVLCPAHKVPFEEFTSIAELGTLWREAHLRSACKAAEHLHDQGWRGVIASAVMAGIPASEFGVSGIEANKCVDEYFGRNNLERKADWAQHRADYALLRELLAA